SGLRARHAVPGDDQAAVLAAVDDLVLALPVPDRLDPDEERRVTRRTAGTTRDRSLLEGDRRRPAGWEADRRHGLGPDRSPGLGPVQLPRDAEPAEVRQERGRV